MKKRLLFSLLFIAISFLNNSCKKDKDTKDAVYWENLAPMPTARHSLGFVECDGLLYAIGGYNADAMNTVEAYNPNNNTWESKASMPTARGCLVTASVNHKIYAIGGVHRGYYNEITLVNEEYDPVSNTWKTKSPLPISNFISGNMYICGDAINGKIYVVVGSYSRNKSTYIYDPVTDTWDDSGNPLTQFNHSPLYCVAINNDLYVSDGRMFLKYNSDKNEWYLLPTSLNKNKYNSALARYNDKILCIGGYVVNENYDSNKDNEWFINLTDVDIFNPSSSSWSRFTPVRTGRVLSASLYFNGSTYIVGGARHYIPYPTGPVSDMPISSLESIKCKE